MAESEHPEEDLSGIVDRALRLVERGPPARQGQGAQLRSDR
jgi:hypothetical protein